MSSINFDPGSAVTVQPNSLCVMAEVFSLAQGSVVKDFPLERRVSVDAVSGTLSLFNQNWHWYKHGDIALCGWIGGLESYLLTFDLHGNGRDAINVPVQAVFPGGVELDTVRFAMLADMTLPTNFRAALVFHRTK